MLNDNLIIDLDEAGRPVGITVEHYSQTVTTPTQTELSLGNPYPKT